jgi:two-component system sensor histidine kinase KdpD
MINPQRHAINAPPASSSELPLPERFAEAPVWRGYAWGIAATIVTALAATPLRPYLELVNIVMLFLLAVVVIAFKFGRGPAVAVAALNVAAFDFFFVPPRYSFAVSDAQYLLTFLVMLVIGLVIGHLAARLRYQVRIAFDREQRSRDLYEMARVLSSALTEEQVIEAANRFIGESFGARAVVLLRARSGELSRPGQVTLAMHRPIDWDTAHWVFDRTEAAGIGTERFPDCGMLYLPLIAPMRTRGILVVEPRSTEIFLVPEQRRQLETFAVLIAIALERVHFVTVAREATVQMESEQLRNSLLAALSHDLRTPLTAILGSADSLHLEAKAMSNDQLALIDAIRDQARRTCELVENILDMARLESGEIHLRNDWQSLEEIIGSAIKARAPALAAHRLTVSLPQDMPLVECDATLIERVLVNLLENAAKYTPIDSVIEVSAKVAGDYVQVSVADSGPGIESGKEQAIFKKFVRGVAESSIPGLGLGLAICRIIVEIHRGKIWVEKSPHGGAQFAFALPRGTPPTVDADFSEAAKQ